MTDSFQKNIILSLTLHGVLVMLFFIRHIYWPSENLYLEKAIRVDIVGLPEKITQPVKESLPEKEIPQAKEAKAEKPVETKVDVKPIEKKQPPKVMNLPKEAEGINLKKTKNRQKEAFEKLKRMEALEKIKQEVQSKEFRQKVTEYKGNVLSPGTSLTGILKLQHDEYQSDIDAHVKQYWQLPQWMAERNLSAQVRIRIDSSGNVLQKQIVKTSGNPEYDEIVLNTIDKAAPFPSPDPKFTRIYELEGLILGFPE